MEKIIGTVPGKCRKKREKARLTLNNNPEISWHMKKSRRTYNGVHLNKKSNTQDVVEQSLTNYLEKTGLLENTMIVYTSDQGFYMGEHGWFDKRFMYEESFRTPLLIRLPGGKKGDIDEFVQNIDYGPTILDLAGIQIPSDMHGISFLPLLRGEKVENWRKSLYYHFYEFPAEHSVKRHYGVRTERYKLIHFYNDIDKWELFDLQEDPMEMNNLYGKTGYENITHQLEKELIRLQKQYQDTNAMSFNKQLIHE